MRYVTSNKTYDFCMFSKFVNFVPIDLKYPIIKHMAFFKIGVHIDWTYTMYHAQKCINKNNVTRISMATKYPIKKHRTFFKTLTTAISPINM